MKLQHYLGGLEGVGPVTFAVLRDFGLELDDSVEVRVWDSSAQVRWFVLPERPPGTENETEEDLAKLVTPESMLGAAKVNPATAR
jgi:nitrile hydratase subunit alpha